jgi:hypothetical protein
MIITRPLRLITLHFSHMGLTEGLTFMIDTSILAAAYMYPRSAPPGPAEGSIRFFWISRDSYLGQVVRRDLIVTLSPGENAVKSPQLAGIWASSRWPPGFPNELRVGQSFLTMFTR